LPVAKATFLVRPIAAVASDAGAFHAAERRRQMTDILRVHPNHSGLKLIGEAQCTGDVGGPKITGQAVLHLICERECLRFVLERDCG
jgi:hypothetical protein